MQRECPVKANPTSDTSVAFAKNHKLLNGTTACLINCTEELWYVTIHNHVNSKVKGVRP